MKINYYKITPGGNSTAIVEGKFTKMKKIALAKAILQQDSSLEQVGFWVSPKNKKALARLEMMGGEFCGNALRALGALLYSLNKKYTDFLLESSGIQELISLQIKGKNSSLKIPLSSLKLAQNNICHLPGISHVLSSKSITKDEALSVIKNHHLSNKKAAGVMPYTYSKGTYSLFPLVWVRDTATLFEETACASGTLALAYFLHKQNKKSSFAIRQPSGKIFRVNLDKKYITLKGPFSTIEGRTIDF